MVARLPRVPERFGSHRDPDDRRGMTQLLVLFSMTSSPSNAGRDDWQGALAARYPLARSVWFECFGGWFPILAHLLERLETAVAALPADRRDTFQIEQIGQKFGTLRVRPSSEGTPEMRAAIEEAVNASAVTCEVCGAPGALGERRGWISVKCSRHENWSRFDDIA
jgi:hypothetical protein